ncbi:MAG TPA: MarR family transcriptional regulator [Nocardioidaceae bacterium]|nr:MarR family transcriptional regulator [Nocardioidaceae bacterium]
MTKQAAVSDVQALSASLVTYASRLGRAVSRLTAQEIPAATLRLLAQLDELGPVGISRLAQADRCSQPTMSGTVQHLVDKGWVTKTPNPADARSSLIELSEAGATVLDEARRRIGAVVAERLEADPCHDVSDVAAAVALLEHLLPTDQGAQ